MLVQCKKCSGQGRIPLMAGNLEIYSRCPVCKGHKRLNIPDNKALCPECDGSGSIPSKVAGLPITSECQKCSGTGLIDK